MSEKKQEDSYQDLYWGVLNDCILRLGEVELSRQLLGVERQEDLLGGWEVIRSWHQASIPEDYFELIKKICHTNLKDAIHHGLELEESEKQLFDLFSNIESNIFLEPQTVFSICIILLGEKSLAHWSFIEHQTLRKWRLSGVPAESREQVLGFEERIVEGFEKESEYEKQGLEFDEAKRGFPPALEVYRQSYESFYQELSQNDLIAVHDAEQTIASNQIAIGQQIYRVRIILNIYGQRKFMEWLKMIYCKICHISWRKAYDLMYAYEARYFVEKSRPDLLPIFDYQLKHFQSEARHSKSDLIPALEDAKVANKRYTLDEVKALFSSEQESNQIEETEEEKQKKQIIGELKMPVRRLLGETLIRNISSYIYQNPQFTVQVILSKALEDWFSQNQIRIATYNDI